MLKTSLPGSGRPLAPDRSRPALLSSCEMLRIFPSGAYAAARNPRFSLPMRCSAFPFREVGGLSPSTKDGTGNQPPPALPSAIGRRLRMSACLNLCDARLPGGRPRTCARARPAAQTAERKRERERERERGAHARLPATGRARGTRPHTSDAHGIREAFTQRLEARTAPEELHQWSRSRKDSSCWPHMGIPPHERIQKRKLRAAPWEFHHTRELSPQRPEPRVAAGNFTMHGGPSRKNLSCGPRPRTVITYGRRPRNSGVVRAKTRAAGRARAPPSHTGDAHEIGSRSRKDPSCGPRPRNPVTYGNAHGIREPLAQRPELRAAREKPHHIRG
jgi:hypothetical protein